LNFVQSDVTPPVGYDGKCVSSSVRDRVNYFEDGQRYRRLAQCSRVTSSCYCPSVTTLSELNCTGEQKLFVSLPERLIKIENVFAEKKIGASRHAHIL